ncbi:MAG TPA: ATP-binding protein [Rhizomicrobium sp.]|nr:ATP-binding protein [Rhizomicrobium sp.]
MQDSGQLQTERAEIVVDDSGRVLHVHAEGRAGRLVEEFEPGATLFDRLHPEDRDIASSLVARALRERRGATAELRWARSGNRWSNLMTQFGPVDAGAVRVSLRYDDIAQLRRAEKQMRRVVEGSAQGIVVRTRDEVLYMNDSFAKLLGYGTYRECMDSQATVNDLIHPEDLPVVLRHLEARIRGEEAVSHYEFRLLNRDGTPIWVETYAANVDWDGKTASLSWISDISVRKAMEEETLRSKEAAEFANRTKTQFLANMSHELRTPLNAILGFSEVIERQMFGPVSAKYLDYAADIHSSGRHLLALVNDVLDLSKLEAGKLELRESEFELPELVEECLTLLRARAESGEVRLKNALPKTLPSIRADARAVKQLLLNFLSNAVKFTPEGGEVRVEVEEDEGLTVRVVDTGIGMTPAEIEVALAPFGQVDSRLARRQDGTGLGLPICRSLMELHGGELRVISAPNVGTTLAAWFPPARVIRAKPERRTAAR